MPEVKPLDMDALRESAEALVMKTDPDEKLQLAIELYACAQIAEEEIKRDKARIDARKKKLTGIQDTLRDTITELAEKAPGRHIEVEFDDDYDDGYLFDASIKGGQDSVELKPKYAKDPSLLPEVYQRVKLEADKARLKQDLKSGKGTAADYAKLKHGAPALTVKLTRM